MLVAVLLVLQAPVEQPAPPDDVTAPPVEEQPRARAEHPGAWLPVLVGVGAAGALLVAPFTAATVTGVAFNAAAGYLSTQSFLATLAVGALMPLIVALILIPGLVVAPVASVAATRVVGRWRAPVLPVVALALLASFGGLLLGVILHEAGMAVGLGLLWATWILVVIIETLVGAVCGAICGSSSAASQPTTEIYELRASREDAPPFIAGMGVWAAALLVPALIGASVGCVAGNVAAVVMGRSARPSDGLLDVDLLDVPGASDGEE